MQEGLELPHTQASYVRFQIDGRLGNEFTERKTPEGNTSSSLLKPYAFPTELLKQLTVGEVKK